MNKKYFLIPVVVNLFDGNPNTNVTTQTELKPEIKTYYEKRLLENTKPYLVHRLFGQKRPIPQGGGDKIEFRRVGTLPAITSPLEEGKTPDGQKMSITAITAQVHQYGGYVTHSDFLKMTAVDPIVDIAVDIISDQAGLSLDTLSREALNAGTNVQYAEGQVASRSALVGGAGTGNHYLTAMAIRMAARTLRITRAPKIDGYYVAIIHPAVSHDLKSDPEWRDPHKYKDTTNLYTGEIGMLDGVRFVESTEVKIFEGAGKDGRDVYSTLVLGKNAYGVTEVEGGGLKIIVKQLGSAGTADPLDQRATVGWKATDVTTILNQEHIVRIETTASVDNLAA